MKKNLTEGPTNQTRRLVLAGATTGVFFPINVCSPISQVLAAAATSFTYDLKPVQIAEKSYVVYGKQEFFTMDNGGDIANVAFINTEEGVVLIDTGSSARYGQALKKLIKKNTGQDVIRVYNTHFHPDHCLGNQAFPASRIAALPETIKGLEQTGEAFSDNLYRLLGDWMRGTELTIPQKKIAISSEKFGSHNFELIPLQGHTDADLAILDHKTGVLYTGDLCFLDRAATTPHADLAKWQAALKQLQKVPHKRLLPGHGPIDETDRSITQTSRYLTWLDNELTTAIQEGKDMFEAGALSIPEEFQAIKVVKSEIERSIAHLYPALEEKYLPMVGGSID